MKVKEQKKAQNFIAENYFKSVPLRKNFSHADAYGQMIGRYEVAQEAYPLIQFLMKKIKKYESKRIAKTTS
jgi:hypothetical protein